MAKVKSKADLKALQKEWYAKLREEGFKDIEVAPACNHEPYLKEWDSHYFHSRNTPDHFKIKQDYFYQAEHFLSSNNTLTVIEKQIWQLHINGLGVRQIALQLNESSKVSHTPFCSSQRCDIFCVTYSQTSPQTKLNKDKVNAIIIKLKALMHIFIRETINQIDTDLDLEAYNVQWRGLVWIN